MKGQIGKTSQAHDIRAFSLNKLSAKLELGRLGRKPKPVSFGHAHNVLEGIAKHGRDHEVQFALIDYRAENKVLLLRTLTYIQAARRNDLLRGSGRAWAKVSSR